jgi:hypothetical protein
MAQNLVVNFIGNNKLDKTAVAANASLRKFERTAKQVGANVNRSLGALGLGLGIATLTNELKKATKAASDDRKAQGLLANALRNTVGATDSAIAGAELFIKNTQLQTAVLDDELRPALATAVRATGSLADGQALLNTALDVSAGTGKDLNTVTNAISKAYNGQTGSLRKLLPSIKDGTNFMEQLNEQFKGSAEAAANLDPYKRLEVIFAEIQETVGTALLPALEDFSEYLASPAGQENVQQLVDGFVKMGEAIAAGTKFLIENIDLIKVAVIELAILRTGWGLATGIVGLYTSGVIAATTATKLLRTALITTGLGALLVGAGFLVDFLIPDEAETQNKQIPKPITTDAPGTSRTGATISKIKAAGKAVNTALQDQIKKIQGTAEKFRDSIGLAFGTFGDDENSVFNVDVVINKMRRIVNAARGFAGNLAKLRKAGADESVISEIVGMGPAQGNIVAKGLLGSGKLSEYLKLRGSLYNTGMQAGTQEAIATTSNYEININKANVSAEDIIRAITQYEKKSGKKVFSN